MTGFDVQNLNPSGHTTPEEVAPGPLPKAAVTFNKFCEMSCPQRFIFMDQIMRDTW